MNDTINIIVHMEKKRKNGCTEYASYKFYK